MAGSDSIARAPTTAVVVNYHSGEFLDRCLRALRESTSPPSLVVVDNDGTDPAVRQTTERHGGRLLINPSNLGYPEACNLGALQANTTYVLFVNPDCRVDTDCIANLQDALDSDVGAALAGGAVRNVDGSEQRGSRRRLPSPWRIAMTVSGLERLSGWLPALSGVNVTPPVPTHPQSIEAVSGAMMLVRRSDFEAVGGFDAEYFLHVEDLDLFTRLRNAGHRIIYVPSAGAEHVKGVSQRLQPVRASRYKHASLVRYLRKFHPGVARGPAGWLLRGLLWSHFALTAPLLWLRGRLAAR